MAEMSPIDWALRPLKRYAQFSGRAPRAEYWWFYLASIVVAFIIGFVDAAVGDSGILGLIFNLAILLPTVAVSVRRLHDINRTGWWLAAFVVPIVGFAASATYAVLDGGGIDAMPMWGWAFIGGIAIMGIVLLVFFVTRGTEGPNDYGPDPYGTDNLGEVFA